MKIIIIMKKHHEDELSCLRTNLLEFQFQLPAVANLHDVRQPTNIEQIGNNFLKMVIRNFDMNNY